VRYQIFYITLQHRTR